MPKKRLDNLDFLKCSLILLMITFHLTYVSAAFPWAKQVVYTFHMPAFLVLTGYLMNMRKEPKDFLLMLWWLFVPYLVMESGYVVMASLLPINEHIDDLTPQVFLDKLLLHPLGPYWYLQTMILCGGVFYAIQRLLKTRAVVQITLSAAAYYGLSCLGVLSFPCAMYFLAGAAMTRLRLPFLEVFRPMWLSALFFLALMVDGSNLDKGTAGGILMVFFAVSLLLRIYPAIPSTFRPPFLFIGRNTLSLYLFSPVFTILCKQLVPFLPPSWPVEARAALFLVVSLPLCVCGSVLISRLLEATGLAGMMFGRHKIIA